MSIKPIVFILYFIFFPLIFFMKSVANERNIKSNRKKDNNNNKIFLVQYHYLSTKRLGKIFHSLYYLFKVNVLWWYLNMNTTNFFVLKKLSKKFLHFKNIVKLSSDGMIIVHSNLFSNAAIWWYSHNMIIWWQSVIFFSLCDAHIQMWTYAIVFYA